MGTLESESKRPRASSCPDDGVERTLCPQRRRQRHDHVLRARGTHDTWDEGVKETCSSRPHKLSTP